MIDYHLHTRLCKHATGTPEDYARRAVEAGIEEIGISDHCPMPTWYDPGNRMEIGQYPEYVGMVRRCRKEFPKLTVKMGIEADFHPDTEAFVYKIANEYEFDYVIGSVHYLGTWNFDNPDLVAQYESRDTYELYSQYYDRIEKMAKTRRFDIVGHPDLIKKFGHRPARDYEALERKALEAVARVGMSLEVNTSGLRRPAKEIYPSLRILKAAFRMGIGITFGSDAHEPGQVGMGFAEALALAREAGYTHSRRYTRRQYETVPLP